MYLDSIFEKNQDNDRILYKGLHEEHNFVEIESNKASCREWFQSQQRSLSNDI